MKKLLVCLLLLACLLAFFACDGEGGNPIQGGEIIGGEESNSPGADEGPDTPNVPGEPDAPDDEHTFSEEWSYDETGHWHDATCEHLGEVLADKAAHSWLATVIKEPTCTEDGMEKITCMVCGRWAMNQVIPASHTFILHDAKEPTCTEDGWKQYMTCANCDYSTYQIVRGEHTPGDWEILQTATCAAEGKRIRRCTTCGEEIERESYTVSHAVVLHPGKEPTCTAPGWYKYETCENCSFTNYVEIPALSHDIVSHEGKEPTTTAIGWMAYETCTRCSYSTYVELPLVTVQHVYVNHEGKAPTCTTIGWEAYVTCAECDYTTYVELPILPHETESHQGREPGCETVGFAAYVTCRNCSYTTYQEMPALGHEEVYHTAQEPSCTENGWMAYVSCTRCGYTTYTPVPSRGHQYDDDMDADCNICGDTRDVACTHTLTIVLKGYAATCIAAGLTDGSQCTLCFAILQRQVAIPATGHAPGAWKTVSEATCTADGKREKRCPTCGELLESEAITATGHTEGTWQITADATCTADGKREKRCATCGELLQSETITALGHQYSATVIPPTETDQGYTEHICSGCGDSYRDTFVDPVAFSKGLAYEINADGKTCTITGKGTCKDADIRIPAVIDGYTVTAIGARAFGPIDSATTSIHSVILPETVTTIGEKAFYYCTNITEIVIPANVTEIGKYAFAYMSGLTKITFAKNVPQIDTYAFFADNNMKGVYIPNAAAWCNASFANVEANPLYYAKTLYVDGEICYRLTIPEGVTKIPTNALNFKSTVRSLVIPTSMKEIGGVDGSDISAIYITDLAAWCDVKAGSFVNHTLYLNGTAVRDLIIPDGKTAINYGVFNHCTSLKSVTLPANFTEIGGYAFSHCINLTTVNIPSDPRLVRIGNQAFYYCSGLTAFTVPATVNYIGANAFGGCSKLTSMTFANPTGWWRSNSDWAISGTVLPESTFNTPSGAATQMVYRISGYYLHRGGYSEQRTSKEGYIYSIIEGTNNCVLMGAGPKLATISIPETIDGYTVTIIGEFAFRDYTVNTIVLPNSVTAIDTYAFSGCSNLTSITLSNNLKSIGVGAFMRCSKLQSITIPASVCVINRAFYSCEASIYVTFEVKTGWSRYNPNDETSAAIAVDPTTFDNPYAVGNLLKDTSILYSCWIRE